ncbi:hypothetical protein L484_001035 [Morus notabilis]|uniref:Uncharacterized protein n=1 Tax=Morus notabilis TaxID=981085 RepID=W9SFB5_9ROSA|nr:hypothetical protein L484_001035 [Morus notabilis]
MATALVEWDQRPNSMPSLEDASMNLVNATLGNQMIGDQHGDAEGVSDSGANNNPRPAKLNRSVGSRQWAARKRAQERAAT